MIVKIFKAAAPQRLWAIIAGIEVLSVGMDAIPEIAGTQLLERNSNLMGVRGKETLMSVSFTINEIKRTCARAQKNAARHDAKLDRPTDWGRILRGEEGYVHVRYPSGMVIVARVKAIPGGILVEGTEYGQAAWKIEGPNHILAAIMAGGLDLAKVPHTRIVHRGCRLEELKAL